MVLSSKNLKQRLFDDNFSFFLAQGSDRDGKGGGWENYQGLALHIPSE